MPKYAGLVSTVAAIYASVIQGSALGPASYVVMAADLHPVNVRNRIFKFADDTYLVVPGGNVDTCQEQIDHLQTWATANNLRLNRDKMKEIVFSAYRKRAPPSPPPPRPDIKRVASLRVLGVIVNNSLTAADHVATLLSSCSRMMYACQTHRYRMYSVLSSSRASSTRRLRGPACALPLTAHVSTLDSLLRRSKRLGYCRIDQLAVADMFSSANDEFFSRIKSNSHHVLQPYLPDDKEIPYQLLLRARSHTMALINKTKFLNDADFIIRLLYEHSY